MVTFSEEFGTMTLYKAWGFLPVKKLSSNVPSVKQAPHPAATARYVGMET